MVGRRYKYKDEKEATEAAKIQADKRRRARRMFPPPQRPQFVWVPLNPGAPRSDIAPITMVNRLIDVQGRDSITTGVASSLLSSSLPETPINRVYDKETLAKLRFVS